MLRKGYWKIGLGAVLGLALIIVLAVSLGGSGQEQDPAETETAAGVQFLKELEAQDPTVVDEEIKVLHQQRIQELREERLQQLESGEVSVWSLFEDYVLLGDSRAVGFYFYEYLPESRVLAEAGATIRNLQEHIPDLVEINPSRLFLCYGLNDVSIGIWPTPESYVEEYAEIIAEIRQKLPDVDIYISSILPARDPAFEQSSAWYDIPQYSAAVKEMCEEIGCYYVDNDALAEKYADLWEVDGIHVQRDFYPHWAANMILEVYSKDLEDADGEDLSAQEDGETMTNES